MLLKYRAMWLSLNRIRLAIRRTQEEHGERLINIEQQMGYMYNRLNGIDDRFNVHMSEMHVLGERVNKNEKDIIRIQNAR